MLIISASVGGGHVAAARALEQACQQTGVAVQHVDILTYTNPAFRRLYRDMYLDLVAKVPDLINWLGKRFDRKPSEHKSRRERFLTLISRLIARRLLRVIRDYEPDIIVHTHFLPSAILALSRHPQQPEAVVVTDYGAHNLWLQRNVGRYFVATKEMRAHLLAAGVDDGRICISGIPIDKRYHALETKTQAREALGLNPTRDVLLLMMAGLEEKTLRSICEQLRQLRWPVHALLICGRSSHYVDLAKRTLGADEFAENDLVKTRVLGFTQDLPRYMAAADCIVGKPGGLTTSEALAAGLPFAVVAPYPIQEEANTTFLLENGVGVRIEPLTVFAAKLSSLLADADRRHSMEHKARQIAKPQAAHDIIASLLHNPPKPFG